MLELVITVLLSFLPTCGESDAFLPTPCGYLSESDTVHSSFIGWNGWLIYFDRAPFQFADMPNVRSEVSR